MSHRVAPPAARFLVYLATLATIWFTPPNGLPAADAVAGGAPTVPAEFERHDAILLSWNADDEGVEEAMTAVVAAVYRNLQVIVLTPDEEYLRGAMRCFSLAGIPQAAIRYVRADVDTIWTRDYGPASLRSARLGSFGANVTRSPSTRYEPIASEKFGSVPGWMFWILSREARSWSGRTAMENRNSRTRFLGMSFWPASRNSTSRKSPAPSVPPPPEHETRAAARSAEEIRRLLDEWRRETGYGGYAGFTPAS